MVAEREGMVDTNRAQAIAEIDAALSDSVLANPVSFCQKGGPLVIGVGAVEGQERLLLVGFDPVS